MAETSSTNSLIPQPPHSVEAEQAVLGGLMLANDAFDGVAALIGEEDFFSLDHQLIFRTMHGLSVADKPLDVITVSETLKEKPGARPDWWRCLPG